jgi:phage FluMu gp28-like protein
MDTPSSAFVGKVFLEVGNGESPETFSRYCEVADMSGIGTKNDQVDVTTFCSNGFKEYVAGLSDGSEMSFGANFSMDEPIQEQLMDDVDDKNRRNVQIVVEGSSPPYIFHAELAMLSYDFVPSVSKQNTIKFTGKSTGRLARTS